MPDKTIIANVANKMSDKTEALLDFLLNLVAVIFLVGMIFIAAISEDGIESTINCVACCWLAGYFCSKTVKSFKIYCEKKGN